MSLKNITKGLLIGAITGGILGSLVGLIDRANTISDLKSPSTLNTFIVGATIGAFIGGGIGHLMRLASPKPANKPPNNTAEQVLTDVNQKAILKLHEEKLDISKEKVQTGEVKVHKEVIQEEKTFTVPVTHEELVIENRVIDPDDPKVKDFDIIRIPLTEEEIEILKHPVVLNEVDIYKEELQEIKTVEEDLKKEKIVVETTGETTVTTKDIE